MTFGSLGWLLSDGFVAAPLLLTRRGGATMLFRRALEEVEEKLRADAWWIDSRLWICLRAQDRHFNMISSVVEWGVPSSLDSRQSSGGVAKFTGNFF